MLLSGDITLVHLHFVVVGMSLVSGQGGVVGGVGGWSGLEQASAFLHRRCACHNLEEKAVLHYGLIDVRLHEFDVSVSLEARIESS